MIGPALAAAGLVAEEVLEIAARHPEAFSALKAALGAGLTEAELVGLIKAAMSEAGRAAVVAAVEET